ncbi:MAG: hypothetical protein VKJ06_04500 [Vampirovibrionales bacterium]|nr:hypothetical protein [Vampirovibrionales bacterium]
MPTLTLVHLYPAELNMYGDRGNILALVQRAAWRGIQVRVLPVGLAEAFDAEQVDILFMGGGQDAQQIAVSEDLQRNKPALIQQAVAAGAVMLGICGGYQLMGHYYKPHQGPELRGLSLMDVHTVAGHKRLIGNVSIRRELPGHTYDVVGFENHSGKTVLGAQAGLMPLGRVICGYGNNGDDGQEGAVFGSLYGSYLHGSLLPKNPALTDELLFRALKKQLGEVQARALMVPLPDGLEQKAQRVALEIAQHESRQRFEAAHPNIISRIKGLIFRQLG